MDKFSVLEHCFEQAFERVLVLKTLYMENMMGDACLPDEIAVASLDFFGDYSGRIVMVLNEYQINEVAQMICQRFQIDVPVDPSIVFSEILNIYAGSLITEVQNLGKNIDISPPINMRQKLSSDEQTRIMRMVTEGRLMFKFCFF